MVVILLSNVVLSHDILWLSYDCHVACNFPQPNATLNYTSWNWDTFTSNLMVKRFASDRLILFQCSSRVCSPIQPNYTIDYTQGTVMQFTTVFAIMFNGCTGIMGGLAN